MVSNLYDGLDWYKIPDRAFSRSVPIRIAKNVIIPVQFADGDNLLITGGTSGMAKVLDARTAETIQTLDHDCAYTQPLSSLKFLTSPTNAADDTIQTIVCHTTLYKLSAECLILSQGFHFFAKKGTRYVATGTSGRRSIIHVWVSKPEPTGEPLADPSTESPAPAPPTPREGPVKFSTVLCKVVLTRVPVVFEKPAYRFGHRCSFIGCVSPRAKRCGLQGLAYPVAVDCPYHSVRPGGSGGG